MKPKVSTIQALETLEASMPGYRLTDRPAAKKPGPFDVHRTVVKVVELASGEIKYYPIGVDLIVDSYSDENTAKYLRYKLTNGVGAAA